ncbi:MAG: D-alanine--D-alanine ligase [Luteococcus sp.]|uniref:D-alanine--D-alanine ligase family protein n=1 Tax=Luteococcus sp. TaxID=1969402 RepID=UPI002649A2BF|nr:D-alanine--D-alanine ligase family protein [Luteococcus sp.]MDN5562340.1 D-alanine--D-alanine ligase [Luteococcus sp.]
MTEHAATARPEDHPGQGDRIRVAVVFGGRSEEHPVSCSTAASVLSAIDRERYEVIPIGITRQGQWVVVDDDPEPLRLRPGQTPEVAAAGTGVIVPMQVGDRALKTLEAGQPPAVLGDVDVVLPLVHGPFGEDGTLQGLFELADMCYVGCGVLASAVMMDKHYMKVVFEAAGLPVGPYRVITDRQWRSEPDAALARVGELEFPVFVKPCRAGSSFGITRVTEPTGLREAIEEARRHDPKVIVEQGIVGREIECGVLQGHGTDAPRVSEPGEIVVAGGHDFYDFDAKYLDGASVQLTSPAEVDDQVKARVQQVARDAFEAAGCEGLARVDSFVTPDGQVILNEINTMPGFTPSSMFPVMWAATGLDYPSLVDDLITLAMERPTGLR